MNNAVTFAVLTSCPCWQVLILLLGLACCTICFFDADIESILTQVYRFQLPKGVAIYSVTSRFNHACLPVRNVNYRINSRADAEITLTALKAVPKGTELTICYGGKPEQLLRGFGFRCQCGGCNPLTDKEAEDIMKAWRGNGNWSNKW